MWFHFARRASTMMALHISREEWEGLTDEGRESLIILHQADVSSRQRQRGA